MNLEEVNDSILADLAGQHRTYFVTSLLSERLDRADLAEILLYAYGTLAGHGEMEEFRADRPVRDHEGFCDCETSRHFWRGVFDQRGTFFLAKDGKVRKRTGSTSGNLRPTFRVAGTQVLLSRLYDFFRLYSAYPQAASEHFLKQIDGEKGKVEMSGLDAQMAVFDLYHGAHVGALMDRAADVLEWKPAAGWGIGDGPGCFKPRTPDLSRIRPIPAGVFDAKG
jgi:hypothetical protein